MNDSTKQCVSGACGAEHKISAGIIDHLESKLALAVEALELCADELEENMEHEGVLTSFKVAAKNARNIVAKIKEGE